MSIDKKINAFCELGEFLSQFSRENITNKNHALNDPFFDALQLLINRAPEHNGWFTKDNVLFALENWSKSLTKENLTNWLKNYTLQDNTSKTVAVIMAGNIPLVGFHDFLSVLLSGNNIIAKVSSNDAHFIPFITEFLIKVEPSFKQAIKISKDDLKGFDAVIATGSNNTARYFDYYFNKYPSIIRHNRNSIAILNGKETQEELEALGEDIFRYFGLGCRSVSKIFVPKEYDFDLLFKAIFKFNTIINYKKYENNYTYNKAVYLMSLFKLTENGFLMLKEDASYSSPISSLFYEYYDSEEEIKSKIKVDKDSIQVIVTNLDIPNKVAFGKTQEPKLTNYADNVDTMEFLTTL